ncbi:MULTISPECIES: hypothetical protein [Acinetobacter]|uniref:Uncharacterized protein n=1 Tax=Acinetobacter indicus TaxID=756892 RepID=A0A6C0Y722_9GAMM|nr:MULTISPECIES: hypothetical protein [Acinetobacter]QIC72041.1 hypothetical protein FSC09_16930 [Acinetobacter indicus]QKQ71559.1 hypothetical protein E5Y90_15105 [Acinetobacter sp. 10FS3-1]
MANIVSHPLVRFVVSIIVFVICLVSCVGIFEHALELKNQGETYIPSIIVSGLAFIGIYLSIYLVIKEFKRINQDVFASLEADLKELHEKKFR